MKEELITFDTAKLAKEKKSKSIVEYTQYQKTVLKAELKEQRG